MWEKDININEIKEIRTRTTVYFGVGAIKKIDDIAHALKEKGINKVIVMSGRNAYKATGAWDYVEKALKDHDIAYVNFAEVTPNPTTEHVNSATKLAREFGAKAVIAIGGGSPTDAGKSVAILLEYPDKCAEDKRAVLWSCGGCGEGLINQGPKFWKRRATLHQKDDGSSLMIGLPFL